MKLLEIVIDEYRDLATIQAAISGPDNGPAVLYRNRLKASLHIKNALPGRAFWYTRCQGLYILHETLID